MSPGDPTEKLPCDGMVEEAQAMAGKLAGAAEMVAEAHDMVTRHVEALRRCRAHCWIRNPEAPK